MRRQRRAALVAGALLVPLVLAGLRPAPGGDSAAAPRAAAVPPPGASAATLRAAAASAFESAPVQRIEGVAYVGANDLARLLEATKFWRADVRKLVLRAGTHRVTLTVDVPFAVVDDQTVWLRAPVVSRRGELQAPVTLLDALPRDSVLARLVFEPRRGIVVRVPRGSLVGSPEASASDTLTRIAFPVERVTDVTVASRARGHFRVRLAGTFVGVLPETLPPASLVRKIVLVPAAAGSAFEFEVAPGASGFRIVHETRPGSGPGPGPIFDGYPGGYPGGTVGVVVLEFVRLRRAGLEEFALEGRPARGVRVIVLDPGHGGADPGAAVGGVVEKDLALVLARLVRAELAHRLPAQVVLTRDDDRDLTPEQRAEVANRARADLVLSLHFDAVPGTQRSGATAWCPPAGAGPREGAPSPRAPFALLPWREVALRHAVQGRAAAEAILEALDLAGAGPVRLRERLMVPLLGVDAPGLMLDCATVSALSDRVRVEDPLGLQALAAAIADGVARWAGGG